MKIKTLVIALIFGLVACKKNESNEVKDYPKEVTFVYNGQETTYKVIKKDYFLNENGDSLEKPIIKLWLDRNLGAQRQAVKEYDSLAAGDLFQWGRFADGHQKINSDTTHILSQTNTPNHNKFIVSPLYSNDWLVTSNNLLWNKEPNTNCPCPNGWRVPTINELAMEMHSWKLYNMKGAYSSSLKWAPGGDRDNKGTFRYADYWAFVWSSTPIEDGQAKILAIIGSDTSEVISSSRISGASVRCIKDY